MELKQLLFSFIFIISVIVISSIIIIISKKFFKTIGGVIVSIVCWGAFIVILNHLSTAYKSMSFIKTSFFGKKVDISLYTICLTIFLIIVVSKVSKLLKENILPKVYKKYKIDASSGYKFSKIVYYIVLFITVLLALSLLGINLTPLTVFASFFGVGIGFGMQNIISNFISGIIILFDKPIKIGDRVVINEITGDVMDITMRATVLRTLDNENIIIPNSYFLDEKVVNKSYKDRRLRIKIDIGVSYDSDMNLVKKAFLEAIDEVREEKGKILKYPEPEINFLNISASTFDISIFVWIADTIDEIEIRSELYYKIVEKTRKYNIDMPYTILDVRNN